MARGGWVEWRVPGDDSWQTGDQIAVFIPFKPQKHTRIIPMPRRNVTNKAQHRAPSGKHSAHNASFVSRNRAANINIAPKSASQARFDSTARFGLMTRGVFAAVAVRA